jgi:hypothetical protein
MKPLRKIIFWRENVTRRSERWICLMDVALQFPVHITHGRRLGDAKSHYDSSYQKDGVPYTTVIFKPIINPSR